MLSKCISRNTFCHDSSYYFKIFFEGIIPYINVHTVGMSRITGENLWNLSDAQNLSNLKNTDSIMLHINLISNSKFIVILLFSWNVSFLLCKFNSFLFCRIFVFAFA